MRYRGEARRADAALEAICSRIDFANTIVVVCSDHGESLGEHGEVTHGYLCYGATLDVPLVLVGPDVPAGEIDARPCSLVDVAPTLRTLCDLPPRQGDGIDLLGLALPELEAYRAVVSESLYAYRLYGWAQQTAAYDGHVSLVDGGPRFELFELSRDPGEERPLEGARATQLDEALLGYRAASVGGAGGALVGVQTPYGSARMQRTAFLPPAENRKLRDVREALPDVAVLNEVRRLIAARRPGLLMQHLPNLELFAAEDASNPAPCLELARAYRMLGDLKQAAEAARMAYERGYDVPDVHKLLLVVLIQAKRMEDARAWFTKHGHRLTPEDRAQFAETLGN
ncbi:MAG: sulfatase-like hydrolase/transferase, partial [Planctomycetota bacterium]